MSEENVTPLAAGRILSDEEFEKLKNAHDQGGAFKTVATARQNCWDAGIEILNHSCSKVNVPQYHIEFALLAHQKINKLKSYFPHLEWLAYLVGVVNHTEHRVTVEDLVIPDSQQVTGASVYNVEYSWAVLPEGKAIIGVIHSHHTMGAFFSGTDDAYINQNHDVSIVVATAKGREIKSQIRVKVPCGAYVLAEDITYSVKYPQVLDEAEFEASFKDKIHTYTPVVTYVNHGYNYLGNYSRGYSGHRGISNIYGGRGMSNPPRGQQMDLYEGYDTTVWDDIEDEYPNPFEMDGDDVREALGEYYTKAEVDEFFESGLGNARNELYAVQQLCMEGVGSDKDGEVHNYGVPLADQGKDSVWNTDEDDDAIVLEDGLEIVYEDDIDENDSLYKRLEKQLESEGLFKGMTEQEKDAVIQESISHSRRLYRQSI